MNYVTHIKSHVNMAMVLLNVIFIYGFQPYFYKIHFHDAHVVKMNDSFSES